MWQAFPDWEKNKPANCMKTDSDLPNMLFNIKCRGKLSSRDFYSPIRHKKEEPATFTEQLRIEMTSLSPLFINLASLIYEPLLHSYLDENYKTTFVDESAVCPCGRGDNDVLGCIRKSVASR